ncbi:MAG: hypothetical protein COA78_01255 [Blastopirellula sp.]|nr:MAG: hypothetical protein COA78_01255 [Blastopirellula sp.]
MRISLLLLTGLMLLPAALFADGEADNHPDTVRRIPRLGIEVPEEDQAALKAGLAKLQTEIDQLKRSKDAQVQRLLPDVTILYRAVHDALEYQEFFKPAEIKFAYEHLEMGMQRAAQLKAGKPQWVTQTGLVVRGFVSKIDGTDQPYGVIVPESYDFSAHRNHRVDVWLHGRGETVSENGFLKQRRTSRGNYTPRDTIVLHPYGRYCNAFKFAGEIDVLESLDSVKQNYLVDEDRISIRGFSMGGAGCWQMAVHYSDLWFAANPGAGFSETKEFLRVFQNEILKPMPWEKKLWGMYDCTGYARNLSQVPTVAYSGEIDRQKQAADIMAEACLLEGLELTHIIGPQTAHKIHPDSAKIVDDRLYALEKIGRNNVPLRIDFTTYTLKYNRMKWLTVDALQNHWERTDVTALVRPDQTQRAIEVATENVDAFSLNFGPGQLPIEGPSQIEIRILNGSDTNVIPVLPSTDRSLKVSLIRDLSTDVWRIKSQPDIASGSNNLAKKHNLQGPIDDALMDSFLFVRPTGKSSHAKVDAWVNSELNRAIESWRRHFRGYARVKNDTDVTAEDIANHNLILWGTPESNLLIKEVVLQLPLDWNKSSVSAGDKKYSAVDHALIAVYPNPKNREKYVVLNSSFTYREFAYLNNARQVPMLPDWAIIDLKTPPGTVWPGKVVAADFFDEKWQLKSK